MATQRKASDLSEFVKFKRIGAAILGRITEQGTNQNGRYVVFHPAAYRSVSGEAFERYQELKVGLSTDLAAKVDKSDTGKCVAFILVGEVPTNQSPRKIFNVVVMDNSEMKDIARGGFKLPAEWEQFDKPDGDASTATSTQEEIF